MDSVLWAHVPEASFLLPLTCTVMFEACRSISGPTLCNSATCHLVNICIPGTVQGQEHRDEQNTASAIFYKRQVNWCHPHKVSNSGDKNKHTGHLDSRSFGLRQTVINKLHYTLVCLYVVQSTDTFVIYLLATVSGVIQLVASVPLAAC